MAKKISVGEKLKKVNSSYTVNQYDNGFMIEVSGTDDDSNWVSSRIIADDVDALVDIIKEISYLPKND